ncbi:hypothetical protein Peur_021548 [Populus x canadensis]
MLWKDTTKFAKERLKDSLLVRLSMKPSLLPEISDSTRQAAGHCYVFFLLFIIDLYWTSERNCVFDSVLCFLFSQTRCICFCSVEHCSFL